MMIIAGGEPDLCCSMAWRGAVLSERVGSMHTRMHYGSGEKRRRAWYTLFAHAFNLPKMWGLRAIF